MTNSRAGGGATKLLYNSGAISSTADHTWTPTTAINVPADYTSLELYFSYKPSASAEVNMTINADGSASYDSNFVKVVTSTVSGNTKSGRTSAMIGDAGTTKQSYITIKISNSNSLVSWNYQQSGGNDVSSSGGGTLDTTSITTISSIKIAVSTGAFTGHLTIIGIKA